MKGSIMKKLLLCGIAVAVFLGDAQAGNGPGKRLASISKTPVKFETNRELMLKYAQLENEAHLTNRATPNFENVQKRGGNPNSTQSVSYVDLGESLNPFSVVATQRNYVSVIPSLNTIALIRRGGTGDPVGSTNAPGNKLMYDYSTNGGTSWTLRAGTLWSDDNYTSKPTYSATNNFGSRYPQGVLWNPAGNTSVDNVKVMGATAVLDGTNGNWGGLGRGWKNMTAAGASSEAYWESGEPLHYIADAIEVNANGDIFASVPEFDVSGGTVVFTDKIAIYKFSYNSTSNRFDSSLVLLPFANEPGDYATSPSNTTISFAPAPNNNIGYLAMNAYNIAYDSLVTMSLYLSKTTDGGATWSDFKVVSVNYKNDVDNTDDIDAFREQMLGNYVRFTETEVLSAQRGEEYAHRVDYFLKDFDLTVDKFGYAHVLAQYCVTSFGDTLVNDPGNLVFYPGYGSWLADITISDLSGPAVGDVIGTTDNIRGCFGDCSATTTSFTEDSRPQVARSADGSTIAMVWFATDEEAHPQGTTDRNSNPDMWVRTISTPSAGVFLANDMQRNMTKGSDYDGLIVCGNVAPILLEVPGGGFEVAATAVALAPNPTATSPWPTQHYYIKGSKTADTIASPITPKVLKSNTIVSGASSKLQVSLSPNPSNGKFVASFFSKSSGLAQVKVVNSIGQVMANYSTMIPEGDVKIPFDMSSLSDGIYFMNISINGKAASQRIVKK